MYFLWDYMEAVDPLERLLVETVELYIVKHHLLRLLSQWKVYKIEFIAWLFKVYCKS